MFVFVVVFVVVALALVFEIVVKPALSSTPLLPDMDVEYDNIEVVAAAAAVVVDDGSMDDCKLLILSFRLLILVFSFSFASAS